METAHHRSILFVELAGARALPSRPVLDISSGGAELISVTSEPAAISTLGNSPNIEILVLNAPSLALAQEFRRLHAKGRTVLVTDMPMRNYSSALGGEEQQLIDHVIVNKSQSHWTTHELRVTLQKLLTGDIFGIEKYLAPGVVIIEERITSSRSRDLHNQSVTQYAQRFQIGQHTAKMIFGITEELLMNAIFDAPRAGGRDVQDEQDSKGIVDLTQDEQALLRYGCDGEIFAVSVQDPFGALTRTKLFEYIRKVLLRRDSSTLIDNKKGGAGLGIFKILYSSHGLVCNVTAGKLTETIALIDIHDQLRDFSKAARSIHYFFGDTP